MIKYTTLEIEKFKNKFSDNPVYALEWVDATAESAVKSEIATMILMAVDYFGREGKDFVEFEKWLGRADERGSAGSEFPVNVTGLQSHRDQACLCLGTSRVESIGPLELVIFTVDKHSDSS